MGFRVKPTSYYKLILLLLLYRDSAPHQALLGILYLGLASSCLAYIFQFYLLQTIGTSTSLTQFCLDEPRFGKQLMKFSVLGSVRQTFVDFLVPVVALLESAVILDSWAHVSVWYIISEIAGN